MSLFDPERLRSAAEQELIRFEEEAMSGRYSSHTLYLSPDLGENVRQMVEKWDPNGEGYKDVLTDPGKDHSPLIAHLRWGEPEATPLDVIVTARGETAIVFPSRLELRTPLATVIHHVRDGLLATIG